MTQANEMIKKFLDSYSKVNPSILYNIRENKNVSISANSTSVFAYLDIIRKEHVLGRLKVSPNHPDLKNFEGIFREYTGKHKIGSWKEVTEVVIDSEKNFRFYIEVFEIARRANQK